MNVRPNFTLRGASNIQEIRSGDVIRYTYWGLSHDGVVVADSSNKSQQGRLRVIHYGTDSLISYRTIKEENVYFDLRKDSVQVISFTCATLETEIVIKRAKSRIGEQRHSIFDNMSCHFVEWAKLGMQPISQCTTFHGTLHLFNVYTWDEMKVGCIVEFPYWALNHQGVLTSFDEKKRVMTVIHYGTKGILATRTIMKETLNINLKKDSLKIYRCAKSVTPNDPDVVIANAEERVGEQNWRLGNTSWDFCLQCLFG
ncbi:hypothetical protein DPMN_074719 [Dreissena polymorpha]|uniref:Uncharacterized protein n=1 Tax=Dreissena polymorpha TaxID=45954 RepID=A0A9D3YFI5_DREPO|nr:hypothetical protein DPMN_074719 [Dreissena polymorpha]